MQWRAHGSKFRSGPKDSLDGTSGRLLLIIPSTATVPPMIHACRPLQSELLFPHPCLPSKLSVSSIGFSLGTALRRCQRAYRYDEKRQQDSKAKPGPLSVLSILRLLTNRSFSTGPAVASYFFVPFEAAIRTNTTIICT